MKNNVVLSVLALFLCATIASAQRPDIQYFRKWDQQGINVFEPSKIDSVQYEGFKIRIGGSFTQDFQSLTHENAGTYVPVSGTNPVNKNLLYGVVKAEDSLSATLTGFNLAMANLNFDFQIADGIRVSLENYMSSRHHSEFWVKGGYIQIDKINSVFPNKNTSWFDDNLRVKIGHFVPNYGDMQFRRTDGGNAMFNPFVENYIFDAFTTEIGGEVYAFLGTDKNIMVMGGMTSGFINGNIENYPEAVNSSGAVATKKSPSIFGKLAYDKQISTDLRFRLSASVYNNSNIQRNTLYAGDRTGSHYFMVMEPALQASGSPSSASAQFTSGRFNPEVSNRVTTFMINPFIKWKGLEVFGTYEAISGSVYADVSGTAPDVTWEKRNFTQFSGEVIYRFLPREQVFAGLRYIGAGGEARNIRNADGSQAEISINRTAFAAGWFPTPNLLLKGEYVVQNYVDFPTADYRHEGTFSGFMVQAVVGF